VDRMSTAAEDRHRDQPLAFRPSAEARAWLAAEAERTGQRPASVVQAALAAWMTMPQGERDRLAVEAAEAARTRQHRGRPPRPRSTTG